MPLLRQKVVTQNRCREERILTQEERNLSEGDREKEQM